MIDEAARLRELAAHYGAMLRIRRFEEKLLELFGEGRLKGTTHVYIGQEAVAVGVCSQLETGDYVSSTHRGHGHCLAKGGSARKLMAEIFGKADGYCLGRGGSQHIIDLPTGFLGANGITGGGLPLALGAAFKMDYAGEPNVSVAFIGDGASNQGTFHESLNMASVWNLPLVVVCENNHYAMYTPVRDIVRDGEVVVRAQAYKIEGMRIDGNDVEVVARAMAEARRIAVEDRRPVLIEALTYRHHGHSKSDRCLYRPDEEEKEWLCRCPIECCARHLREGGLGEAELARLEQEAVALADDAVAFAEASPAPVLDPALETSYCYSTEF